LVLAFFTGVFVGAFLTGLPFASTRVSLMILRNSSNRIFTGYNYTPRAETNQK